MQTNKQSRRGQPVHAGCRSALANAVMMPCKHTRPGRTCSIRAFSKARFVKVVYPDGDKEGMTRPRTSLPPPKFHSKKLPEKPTRTMKSDIISGVIYFAINGAALSRETADRCFISGDEGNYKQTLRVSSLGRSTL